MTRMVSTFRSWIFPVCALLGWEALAQLGFLQGRWPSLVAVIKEFAWDWPTLLMASVRTAWQVLQASVIGVVVGVSLGVFLSAGKRRIHGLYGCLAGLKAVPVTVLVPVFLTLFGLETFIVPLVALPLSLNFCVNTAQAIAEANQTRLRMLLSWSVSYGMYARHVLPFECLDAMLQTARVMLPFAFALHIALDYFLCIPNGLGCYVNRAYERQQHARMYGAILVAGIIGLALGAAIDLVSRRSLKWKRDM